jgi:hypothetical protein
MPLKWSPGPDDDGRGDIGINPAPGWMGRSGWGATGVVDRLVYCGVRFGLSLGDEAFELVELVEIVELGLDMTLAQGLFVVVGVVLLLVVEDTDEAVGDGGPRLYHDVGSSCRFTMDMVCWRLYCGL